MNSLIIGAGEVGKALHRVLLNHHAIFIRGEEELDFLAGFSPEIIHICFPYSDKFVEQVKAYQKQYKPRYTVIHSTVPIGTSKICKAYHSPIRGVHPNLEGGIITFVKYLAPKSDELKEYFEKANIEIKMIDKPENTEALKLWSTTQYKRFIDLEKEMYNWCEERGLDFDVIYTDANKTYNDGYKKLEMDYFVRPILKHMPGDIGGHCVLSNYKLLNL